MTGPCRPSPVRRCAFTLVEVVVGVVIAAVVVGATSAALSQLGRASAGAQGRAAAAQAAEHASAMIARDLANVVRDSDLLQTRVAIADGGTRDAPSDQLLIVIRSLRPVLGEEDLAEGADYELQYKLLPGQGGAPALWRRTDPGLDAAMDGGGVAYAIADGILTLSFEACDGESWFATWDSDVDGVPHGVRVTITAADPNRRYEVTARRVVAIDRIAPPPPSEEESDEEPAEPTPSTPANGGNTGGGNTGGGNTGGGNTGGGNTGGGNTGGGRPGGGE